MAAQSQMLPIITSVGPNGYHANMLTPYALVTPSISMLDDYADALRRGWSPDNVRGRDAADEQIAANEHDPAGFIAALDDEDAKGPPVILPDGSCVARLPGLSKWMWDGEFCGAINFRWQHGKSELPPYVLGHVGFGVVPWKRGNGYAAKALRALLPFARQRGLAYVELTTTPDNLASRRTIEHCGGQLVEHFVKDKAYGGGEALRFRIDLPVQR
jgi:predicted acetyltransferase